jgi:hypothetical protein
MPTLLYGVISEKNINMRTATLLAMIAMISNAKRAKHIGAKTKSGITTSSVHRQARRLPMAQESARTKITTDSPLVLLGNTSARIVLLLEKWLEPPVVIARESAQRGDLSCF